MNTAKLRGKFAERGLPLYTGAQCLKMSERTFYSKIKSGKLGCKDAEKLSELLNITDDAEKVDIFLR